MPIARRSVPGSTIARRIRIGRFDDKSGRFRSMRTLQKFISVRAQVHNHFNQERHLVTRQVYKQRRSTDPGDRYEHYR